MYEKIEETRICLMEQYGYPSVKKFGNMTYKTINQELDSFNRLISALTKACDLLKIENYDKAIYVICEYCKDADAANMGIVANKIEKMNKELIKGINFSRKKFRNLIADLNLAADKKDFNPHAVINYFVEYLSIRAISYNIKNERRYIDRDGNFFWGGNSSLDD